MPAPPCPPLDSVLGVPLDSTGRFEGCQLMPAALRAAGLTDLPLHDLGNLQVAIADPRRHRETQVTGYDDLLAASRVVADALDEVLVTGRRPLVVGGDCSMLLGLVAGVQRARPGAGLVFVDGHADTHTPATSETGDAADMEMGILLGVGPAGLVGLNGSGRLLDPGRVALLGARDHDEMVRLGSPLPQVAHPEALVIDADALLRADLSTRAGEALAHLRAGGAESHWLHVDLDVLSTAALPAVDYPQPGGLDWDQLGELVRPIVSDPSLLGVSVAILNPSLKGGEQGARDTVRWLGDLLGTTE